MKKPIGVFLTDTHLTKDNHVLVQNIFEQAAELALSIKTNVIFFGGDAFTNRIAQNLDTLLIFGEILESLEEKGVKVIAIPGNHDKTNQDSPKSYLDIFKNYSNFQLIREGEFLIDFDENVAVALLPFFTASYKRRLKDLNASRKELKNKGFKTVLITHHAFNGVMNNDGTKVEDGISTGLIKNWDLVLVGHYHNSSEVGNALYTGSSYQGNHGENTDDKGFTIIYSDATQKKFLSDFPIYKKIELRLTDNIDEEIEFIANQNHPQEDNIRIVFKGKREDLHKVDQVKLKEMGIDVKFEYDEINEEILKAEQGEIVVIDRKNLVAYFQEFCEIQEVPKDKKGIGLKMLIKDGI